VRGTAQIFTCVGQRWPFYSYRIATLTQHSKELDRTFRAELLNLVTDLEGSSEVGGLFLHPGERAGGLGLLLARSRYLFIAMHRAALPIASLPNCAASSTNAADRRSGTALPGASSA
jgi:arginine N-succinyltransferase